MCGAVASISQIVAGAGSVDQAREVPFAGDDPEIELVVAGELSLLDPEVRRSRAASSALLDEQFHELGSSGTVWDRESVLDSMLDGADPPPEVVDMAATRLAPDVIFLTYRTRRPGRATLRSSVWRRRAGGRSSSTKERCRRTARSYS